MRIEETKTYTVELSAEEFELLHPICKSVGYVYRFLVEENVYTMIITDDMLYDMKDLLESEQTYQLYEECNRPRAERIRDLLDDIYYELR
jgi:hypothetical protein